jgi:LSD1 subclass zinc finger protein
MASLVCATCRKLIPPGTSAIRCTVASCNTGRMKLRFCSVTCWDKHVPTARHRKASYLVEGERDTSVGHASSPVAAVAAEPVVDEVAEVGEASGKS